MTSEVTQADRDAALPFIATDFRPGDTYSTGYYVRRGERDDHPLVQAFARHRLTTQSGEGRSGAGGDAGPFHVSQSGDGKKLWFSARDPASGVTIPARDRTDARNLVSSLNHACATFAALNARQSGEGEREALRIIKAWLDWYRFATGDDDCQYLNGKGWDDAEALASTSMGYLAALRATDDAGGA